MDVYHFEQTEIGKSLCDARAIAAGDFTTPQLQGQRGGDYDSGFMDACRIIRQHPHFDALPELVEVLRFYAEKANWNTDWEERNPAHEDRGTRARALLARLESE